MYVKNVGDVNFKEGCQRASNTPLVASMLGSNNNSHS